jgi:hypothetical protein
MKNSMNNYEKMDAVGELSRTCCQLVQGGINTEPILDKLAACPTKSCPN